MTLRRLVALAVLMMWAGTAASQTDWVLYEGNPVIPGAEADEWAGLFRWPETVIVVEGTYHMFLTGTAVAFTYDHEIGHATSPDGISWTMDPQNPVLTPEAEGDWEVTSFLSLAVMHDGTEFRMWYGGADSGGFCQVGMATSQDGSAWTRYSENPVFETGPVGSFDHGVVMPATVFRHHGLYHMWYSADGEPTVFSRGTIGYATSVDGLSWVRHSSPVLEPGPSDWDSYIVYGPAVVFDGSSYHMWYTGIRGYGTWFTGVQIGYATSTDGISWTKDPGNPIDVLGGLAEQPQVLLHARRRECEMIYSWPENNESAVNRATSSCQAFAQIRRPFGRRVPVRGKASVVAPGHK